MSVLILSLSLSPSDCFTKHRNLKLSMGLQLASEKAIKYSFKPFVPLSCCRPKARPIQHFQDSFRGALSRRKPLRHTHTHTHTHSHTGKKYKQVNTLTVSSCYPAWNVKQEESKNMKNTKHTTCQRGWRVGRSGAMAARMCVCVFKTVSSCLVIGNAHTRPEMICIFVVFKWSLLCWTITITASWMGKKSQPICVGVRPRDVISSACEGRGAAVGQEAASYALCASRDSLKTYSCCASCCLMQSRSLESKSTFFSSASRLFASLGTAAMSRESQAASLILVTIKVIVLFLEDFHFSLIW